MDTETMIDEAETIVSEAATKKAKAPRKPRGLVNALWVAGLDQAEQLADEYRVHTRFRCLCSSRTALRSQTELRW